jgi:hypothetical protein
MRTLVTTSSEILHQHQVATGFATSGHWHNQPLLEARDKMDQFAGSAVPGLDDRS